MANFQNDIALIQKAQRGDLDAFNTLVRRYQDDVYSLAYRIMNDAHAASDAAQEAFISAYRQIKTFRGGSGEVSFRAWLLRIAANRCYDELRRRKRRPAVSVESLVFNDDGDGSASETPDLPDPGDTPEQVALSRELQRAIQGCIGDLHPDQRVVLVMCDVEGIDYQSIADSVGVALGTVKSRLSRARAAVRDCLSTFGELLPAEFRLNR